MSRYEENWTPFEPVDADRVREGKPATRLAEAVCNERFTSGLWEVTPGRFSTAPQGYNETIHILSGRGELRADSGASVELSAGTSLLLPEGFKGEWIIHEQLKKFYVQVLTNPVV